MDFFSGEIGILFQLARLYFCENPDISSSLLDELRDYKMGKQNSKKIKAILWNSGIFYYFLVKRFGKNHIPDDSVIQEKTKQLLDLFDNLIILKGTILSNEIFVKIVDLFINYQRKIINYKELIDSLSDLCTNKDSLKMSFIVLNAIITHKPFEIASVENKDHIAKHNARAFALAKLVSQCDNDIALVLDFENQNTYSIMDFPKDIIYDDGITTITPSYRDFRDLDSKDTHQGENLIDSMILNNRYVTIESKPLFSQKEVEDMNNEMDLLSILSKRIEDIVILNDTRFLHQSIKTIYPSNYDFIYNNSKLYHGILDTILIPRFRSYIKEIDKGMMMLGREFFLLCNDNDMAFDPHEFINDSINYLIETPIYKKKFSIIENWLNDVCLIYTDELDKEGYSNSNANEADLELIKKFMAYYREWIEFFKPGQVPHPHYPQMKFYFFEWRRIFHAEINECLANISNTNTDLRCDNKIIKKFEESIYSLLDSVSKKKIKAKKDIFLVWTTDNSKYKVYILK